LFELLWFVDIFALTSFAPSIVPAASSGRSWAGVFYAVGGTAGVVGSVLACLWLLEKFKEQDNERDQADATQRLRSRLVAPESVAKRVEPSVAEPLEVLAREADEPPSGVPPLLSGRLEEIVPGPRRIAQDVDLTVFAPIAAPPREEVIVQVIFHTPEREIEAQSRASKVDADAQTLASVPLTIQLRVGDNIKVTLESDGLTISEPVQTANWNGRLVCVYFTARMPRHDGIVRPRLRVFVNGVPAGTVVFKISVEWNPRDQSPSPVEGGGRAFRRPFLSYASEDRVQVLKAAQLLGALKIQCFQDVLSLSPGERWERRLYEEIDRSDLFLLFWSRSAQKSEWVIREAEYALKRLQEAPADRQLEIVPVLLEGPPAPLPPASLNGIHFNDPIRHIIFAEESVADAKKAADRRALDRFAQDVGCVFVTKQGMIASIEGGTAIAIVGDKVERFDSLEDYRVAYHDNEPWVEWKDKLTFCAKAQEVLQQIIGEGAFVAKQSPEIVSATHRRPIEVAEKALGQQQWQKPINNIAKWSSARRAILFLLCASVLSFGVGVLIQTAIAGTADMVGASLFVVSCVGACILGIYAFLRPSKAI
jgi:TIR domain